MMWPRLGCLVVISYGSFSNGCSLSRPKIQIHIWQPFDNVVFIPKLSTHLKVEWKRCATSCGHIVLLGPKRTARTEVDFLGNLLGMTLPDLSPQ